MEIILKPKTDPRFSCPQSVLYLPIVIEGIRNGEIILEIIPEGEEREYKKPQSDINQ